MKGMLEENTNADENQSRLVTVALLDNSNDDELPDSSDSTYDKNKSDYV